MGVIDIVDDDCDSIEVVDRAWTHCLSISEVRERVIENVLRESLIL